MRNPFWQANISEWIKFLLGLVCSLYDHFPSLNYTSELKEIEEFCFQAIIHSSCSLQQSLLWKHSFSRLARSSDDGQRAIKFAFHTQAGNRHTEEYVSCQKDILTSVHCSSLYSSNESFFLILTFDKIAKIIDGGQIWTKEQEINVYNFYQEMKYLYGDEIFLFCNADNVTDMVHLLNNSTKFLFQ